MINFNIDVRCEIPIKAECIAEARVRLKEFVQMLEGRYGIKTEIDEQRERFFSKEDLI